MYHCAGGGDAGHDDIPKMVAPARLLIYASPSLYQLIILIQAPSTCHRTNFLQLLHREETRSFASLLQIYRAEERLHPVRGGSASPPYREGRLILERGECAAKAPDRLHARPPIRKIDELEGGD